MEPKQRLFSNRDVKLVSIHLKGQGVAQWQSSGSNTSTEKKIQKTSPFLPCCTFYTTEMTKPSLDRGS